MCEYFGVECLNEYMQCIEFFYLRSNQGPEKPGFRQIKRANPWTRIRPLFRKFDLNTSVKSHIKSQYQKLF